MSNNDERDDALKVFTEHTLEEVVKNYHDRIDMDNVEKLIECSIAKKLSFWIPARFTETKVTVEKLSYIIIATVDFMIDGKTKMRVLHREAISDLRKLTVGSKLGRGSKVETLPGGQGLGELSDLEYFRQKVIKGLKLPNTMTENTTAESWFAPAGLRRGIVNDLITKPISLGVSSRGVGIKDDDKSIFMQIEVKSHPGRIYSSPTNYAPLTKKLQCEPEITVIQKPVSGIRGKDMVQEYGIGDINQNSYTAQQKRKLVDGIYGSDNEFPLSAKYRQKLINNIENAKIPAPTDCVPLTKKTPVGSGKLPKGIFTEVPTNPIIKKPTVDFSKISSLSPPEAGPYAGCPAGTWVGVDLGKFDVHQECIDRFAKEMADRIDREILQSLADEKIDTQCGVPTFGWTEETTKWNVAGTGLGYTVNRNLPASGLGYSMNPSEFSGVVTTDSAGPVWFKPDGLRSQPIEFTEEDLDLLDMTGSKVMEFV